MKEFIIFLSFPEQETHHYMLHNIIPDHPLLLGLTPLQGIETAYSKPRLQSLHFSELSITELYLLGAAAKSRGNFATGSTLFFIG